MIKSKKAGERYMTPYLFFIWVGLVVAVIVSVLVFYSIKGDVRGAESEIFISKIVECIIKDNQLASDFSNSWDILENCKIDQGLIGKKEADFYISIKITKESQGLYNLIKGNPIFEEQCELPGEHMPSCASATILALKGKEKIVIKIKTGSNNQGERYQ